MGVTSVEVERGGKERDDAGKGWENGKEMVRALSPEHFEAFNSRSSWVFQVQEI